MRVGNEHSNGNKTATNGAVILHAGAQAGRLVVAYYGEQGLSGLPKVVHTDDGTNWPNAVPQTWKAARVLCNGEPEDVLKIPDSWGVPLGGISHAIAADRATGDVYLVFSAITSGASFSDLFVAKGTLDGNGNLEFLGSNVLHLRDVADLGQDEETDQILPTITIDQKGGVNIAYYAARPIWDSLDWEFEPRYARITNFSTCPRPQVAGFRLAGWSDTVVTGIRQNWIGDYIQADSRGCEVFVGWMSRHEGDRFNVYVSKIACAEMPTRTTIAPSRVPIS